MGAAQGVRGRGALAGRHARRRQRLAGPVREPRPAEGGRARSEEHTSELQSLMRISYAVFCLKKKTNHSFQIAKIGTPQLQPRVNHSQTVTEYYSTNITKTQYAHSMYHR